MYHSNTQHFQSPVAFARHSGSGCSAGDVLVGIVVVVVVRQIAVTATVVVLVVVVVVVVVEVIN